MTLREEGDHHLLREEKPAVVSHSMLPVVLSMLVAEAGHVVQGRNALVGAVLLTSALPWET